MSSVQHTQKQSRKDCPAVHPPLQWHQGYDLPSSLGVTMGKNLFERPGGIQGCHATRREAHVLRRPGVVTKQCKGEGAECLQLRSARHHCSPQLVPRCPCVERAGAPGATRMCMHPSHVVHPFAVSCTHQTSFCSSIACCLLHVPLVKFYAEKATKAWYTQERSSAYTIWSN